MSWRHRHTRCHHPQKNRVGYHRGAFVSFTRTSTCRADITTHTAAHALLRSHNRTLFIKLTRYCHKDIITMYTDIIITRRLCSFDVVIAHRIRHESLLRHRVSHGSGRAADIDLLAVLALVAPLSYQ